MGSLKINQTTQDKALELKLTGQIDEDSVLPSLNLVGVERVKVDFSEVSYINSCGIREWLKWITPMASQTQIIYSGCPKPIVDQMNMIEGFLPPKGIVETFYVPYFSEGSGTEKSVLFTRGKEFTDGGELKPPAGIKDDAGAEMEMDVIESKYFKFLQKK